jgi:hypothetical protein
MAFRWLLRYGRGNTVGIHDRYVDKAYGERVSEAHPYLNQLLISFQM